MSVKLWTEAYRPATLSDYIWRNQQHRLTVQQWIASGAVPNVVFAGRAGTGKTSLAYLILNQLGIPAGDIKFIAASRERQIDKVQDSILNFVSTYSFNATGLKYVILDEADTISTLAQEFLRTEMERYSDTCRFILTCNKLKKIIDPLQSRCQVFQFDTLDRASFAARAESILAQENVAQVASTAGAPLDAIIARAYPDMRKCINLMQKNVIGGVLQHPDESTAGNQAYLVDVAELFLTGRTLDARRLLVKEASVEDYDDIYRFMYDNLEIWGDTPDQQDDALLIIKRGLVSHSFIADPEINLSATMVELARLR